MGNKWDADFEIGPEEALACIQEQFPQIAAKKITLLGVGWDNIAYLIDGELIFRFPRRESAIVCMEGELATLPHLSNRLPLPIPKPEWVSAPIPKFPYPFGGYRMLKGRTACSLNLSDEKRIPLAAPLGHFLKTLHTIPLELAYQAKLRGDTFDRVGPESRKAQVRELGEECLSLGLLPSSLPIDRATRAKYRSPQPTSIVHGDMYARHLLLNGERHLSGIIDWGDIHIGEPALDLMIVYTFFPVAAHPAFWQAYGAVDEVTKDLARFCALRGALNFTLYAYHEKDEDLLREGRQALSYLGEEIV